MAKKTAPLASYTPHHFADAEGHIAIDKPGACTISLIGAASMTQEELDFYGRIMAQAVSKLGPVQRRRAMEFEPRDYQPEAEIVTDVRACSRCGEDHLLIGVRPFTKPVHDAPDFRHFSICPNTQEPILLCLLDEEEAP